VAARPCCDRDRLATVADCRETAFLNQMTAPQKKKLVPLFISALENNGVAGSPRGSAAVALKYCPEQAPLIAPALVKATQDPFPYVRLKAAEALNRVDPGTAKKAGAVTVVIKVLQDPNDPIAMFAAMALCGFQDESEAAVAALIEALHSTNSLVGCHAVWSLEHASSQHAERIIPEMRKAAERKENVGGYARMALEGLESRRAAK